MKKLFVVLAAILLLAIMACSGKGDDVSSKDIGPAGGTIVSSDGNATLNVPVGALATSISITIAPSTANLPQGNIGTVVLDFGPEGTTFATPVTISLKYDPNLIPHGVAESSLTLAFVSGSEWIDIPTTVDTVNKLLIGQTTHFSPYGGKIADTNKLPYDKLIGITTNGVAVYSNGCIDPSDPKDPKTGKSIYPSCMTINGQAYPTVPNTDNAEDYNSGFKWQCVEFVNRYYYQIYGTSVSGGNANVYYQNAAAKGLIAYPNRGSVPPQIGDIIVSEGNINNVGHVAIVWDVSPNNIHLVEQNWNEGPGDLDHVLAITSGNNVADFNTAYPVTGWLRLPSVSGKVTLNGTGLPGVGVMLTGNSSKQTSTDANGNYSFAGVVNGSYTLIAFESGYAFTPSSQSITVNNVDLAKLTVNKGILTVQDIIAAVSSTIPTSYTIIDLGSLGGERTSANGINNSGQVVGGSEIDYTTGNTHAFLYSDGTMKDLGTLPGYPWSYATAINDLGQIVGTIDPRDYNMSFHAFLYSDGTITDLGTLPGTTRSNAWDINNSGDVVGYSYNPTRAFIYNGGTMKAFGSDGCMTAQGINNSGQVVGIITDPPNYTFSHAFLSDGETIRDLGTLGGRNSNAAGINDSGQVVGQSENLSGLARAFLYSDGTMIDLGTLPGDNQSIAIAINNSGQIVGFSFNPDGSSRAFLYSGGTMIDLQTLLGPDSDWTYLSPSGINDKGQIIGVGQRKNLFGQKAFLMTPN